MAKSLIEIYNALKEQDLISIPFEQFQARYTSDPNYKKGVDEDVFGGNQEQIPQNDNSQNYGNSPFMPKKEPAVKKKDAMASYSASGSSDFQPSTQLPKGDNLVQQKPVRPVYRTQQVSATPTIPKSYDKEGEEDYLTGTTGKVLKTVDKILPIGLGDWIDDMARSYGSGAAAGKADKATVDLLIQGATPDMETVNKYIDAANKASALPPSKEMQRYQETYEKEGGGFWGFLKASWENPGILPEIMLSSYSELINNEYALKTALGIVGAGAGVGATTAGTAGTVVPGVGNVVGAVGGGIAGGASALPYAFGAANVVLEVGSTYSELIKEALGDKEFTKENVKELLEDDYKIVELRNKAVTRGITIGVIDAITGKVASNVGAKSLMKSAAKSATGEATKMGVVKSLAKSGAIETAGGSAGEAAGRASIGQEMDFSEIALEGVAEAPGNIKATIQARLAKPVYKVNGEKVSGDIVDDLIKTMTPEELAKSNIEIENDYTGKKKQIQDKIVDYGIKKQILQANPNIDDETANNLVSLEKELNTLEGNKTQVGRDRAAQIRSQIKEVTENAVQKQTTSEVPVQPAAGVGEKVAEGVPQPKPVLTTEQIDEKQKRQATLQEALDKAEEGATEVVVGEKTIPIADAQNELKTITESLVETKPTEVLATTLTELAPDQKQEVTFLDEDGTEVAMEGNEKKLADIYNQALAADEKTRTDSQKSAIEAVNNLGLGVQPQVAEEVKVQPVSGMDVNQLTELESRVTDDLQKRVVGQVRTAVRSVRQMLPNLEFVVHEDENSYDEAMAKYNGKESTAGNFAYGVDADGNKTMRVDINLKKANSRTVTHELGHAVLYHAFGDSPTVFKAFAKRLSPLVDTADVEIRKANGQKMKLSQYLNDFANQEGYAEEVKPEEFLVEMSAALSSAGGKISTSTWVKIGDLVNKVVSKLTNGKVQVFENSRDTKATIEFFNDMATRMRLGVDLTEATTKIAKNEKAKESKGKKGSKSQLPALQSVEATAKALEGVDIKKLLPNSYHGRRGEIVFDENKPMFFTDDINGAEWYSKERGDESKEPNILSAIVKINNPFKLDSQTDAYKFVEVIKRAGYDIEIVENENGWDIPRKYTKPIRENSPYDGDNLVDWIYVPNVKEQLTKEGYDGIEGFDVLGNDEIRIQVPFKKSQIKELTPKNVAEAYHQAKQDNSNPKLVQAVEDVLSTTTKSKSQNVATAFSGAGTMEAALKDPTSVMAVEFNPNYIKAYNEAFGTKYNPRDVNKIDPQEVIDAKPDIFHASPVCKSFSKAKNKATVLESDMNSAKAVAKVITEAKPPVVTIENVTQYKGTVPYNVIINALEKAGYTYDANFYNAADYGGVQSRDRLIIRAVREGELPPMPEKKQAKDWFKAIESMIDDAPDTKFTSKTKGQDNWEVTRINDMIKKGKLDPKKPIITMGGSAYKGVAAAANPGGPAPTLLSSKGSVPRIIMPNGKVKRVTPEMMRVLMDLPDTYKVPSDWATAKEVLGNGISGVITKAVIQPMAEVGEKINKGMKSKSQLPYFKEKANQLQDENTLKNDKGEPIIFYHGTTKESANNIRKNGFDLNNGRHGVSSGISLISNEKYSYSDKGDLIRAIVSMKNPMDFKKNFEIRNKIAKKLSGKTIDQFTIPDWDKYESKIEEEFNVEAKRLGYDGVYDKYQPEITVFDPSNIKVLDEMVELKSKSQLTNPTSNNWSPSLTQSEVDAKLAEVGVRTKTENDKNLKEEEKGNETQRNNRPTYNAFLAGIINQFGRKKIKDISILDAGAGFGMGAMVAKEQGIDDSYKTFEPFPSISDGKWQKFSGTDKPNFTNFDDVKSESQDIVVSNAVLNVVPADIRESIVYNIGRVLKPNGKAYISVRGIKESAIESALKSAKEGKGNNVFLSDTEYYVPGRQGDYQKGFSAIELQSYIQDVLGNDFTVEISKDDFWKNNSSAPKVIVTKTPITTKSKSQLDAKQQNQVEALKKEAKRIFDTGTANGDKKSIIRKAIEDFVKSSATYNSLPQIEHLNIMSDVLASVGMRLKGSPSYNRLFGFLGESRERKNEMNGLLNQIKTLERGGKDVQNNIKSVMDGIKSAVKKMGKDGVLTSSQMASIINKMATMNPLDKKSVANFKQYLTEQFKKAEEQKNKENMRGLKDQIKFLNRGGNDVKKIMSEAKKVIIDALSSQRTTGVITAAKAAAIVKRFAKVNLLNDASIDRFINYVSNILQKADYINKINNIRSLKQTLRKLASNTDKNPELRDFAKKMLRVDEGDLDATGVWDIDDYTKYLEELIESIRGSKLVSPSPSKIRQGQANNAYDVVLAGVTRIAVLEPDVDAILDKQEAMAKQDLALELQQMTGQNTSGMTMKELRKAISDQKKLPAKDEMDARATINDVVTRLKDIINDMFRTGIDPITGGNITFTQFEKDTVMNLMSIDIDKLGLDVALDVLDMLNNYIANRSIANMGNTYELYMGSVVNPMKVLNKGVEAVRIKKYFLGDIKIKGTSFNVGRLLTDQFASLPAVFERIFVGSKQGEYVRRMMGVSDVMVGKTQAQKYVNNVIENYISQFSKTKPNGEAFNSSFNVVERGMSAFMGRSVFGNNDAVKDEFSRRKRLIEESIEALEKGTKSEQKKAEVYKKVYDKILKNANDYNDVKSNVNSINQSATNFWVNEWNRVYDRMSDVAKSIYNQNLGKDVFYTPDVYSRMEEDDSKSLKVVDQNGNIVDIPVEDMENTDMSFIYNTGLYRASTGQLMQVVRPEGLPKGTNGKSARFINLSFDMNMTNTLYNAMVDINTADKIRRADAFMASNEFEKIIPNKNDRQLLKDRVKFYFNNIRGIVPYTKSTDVDAFVRSMNNLTTIGASMALSGVATPFKQVIPVMLNTIINTGGRFKMMSYFDRDQMEFVRNSGYGIAIRAADALVEIESLNKMLEKSDQWVGSKLFEGLANVNKKVLYGSLVYFDKAVAATSWLTYYEQGLRKQNIPTQNIDYKNHTLNKEAADYAEDMVNRQQNISDHDLAGKFFQTKGNSAKAFLIKAVMPFASFIVNQKVRMGNDLRTLQHYSTSTREDKMIAIRSLSSMAVEMLAFKMISGLFATMISEAIASFRGGVGDDDEDKIKKEARRESVILRGQVTSTINDIFSPVPFLDPITQFAAYQVIDKIQAIAEIPTEDRNNIFEMSKTDFIKQMGMYGIMAQRAKQIWDIGWMAYNGEFTDRYTGKQKWVSVSDQEIAKMFGLTTAIALASGVVPVEANTALKDFVRSAQEEGTTIVGGESLVDKINKLIEKDTNKMKSAQADEARRERLNALQAILQKVENPAQIDIINKMIQMDTMNPEEKSVYISSLKGVERDKYYEKQQLLSGYDNPSDMKKYNRALYEENFGKNSEYYKKNLDESYVEYLLSEELNLEEEQSMDYVPRKKKKPKKW